MNNISKKEMMDKVIGKYGHESREAIDFCERCERCSGSQFGIMFLRNLYKKLMGEV